MFFIAPLINTFRARWVKIKPLPTLLHDSILHFPLILLSTHLPTSLPILPIFLYKRLPKNIAYRYINHNLLI